MIGLLCSVEAEAAALVRKLKDPRASLAGSRVFTEGTLAGRRVILCAAGMGKVNAAHGATLLITRFGAKVLVVFGIGGAYPGSGAKIGDIALATREIAGDEGVITPNGFKDTEYIGIPLATGSGFTCFNDFKPDPALLGNARKTLRRTIPDAGIFTGPFITLSACSGTDDRAALLERTHEPLCENMEGAACAQIAALHGIPWIEVRSISNIVENRDMKKWNIPLAAERIQEALERLLEEWQ